MLTFAENEDDYDYDTNVSKKVKGLTKENVREIIFLTDEQIMKIKDELLKRQDYQKATLLMLAYDSAARKGELQQVMKASFYDTNKNITNKVIGKRRKVFPLIYFTETKKCAKLWLEQRGIDDIDSMWIITSNGNKHEASSENIYDWFMQIRQILSTIEGREIDMNVHSMRHSSLQNFTDNTHYYLKEIGAEKGFPIEKLRLFAHHENINTTNEYLRDTTEDEIEEMFKISIK
jgi:hypothetical protein